MSDVRIINDVLRDAIKHGNHGNAHLSRQHDDDTAETVIAKQLAAEPGSRRERSTPLAVPAIKTNDVLGVATTLSVTPNVVTDSTATQLTETRSIRAKTPAVVVADDDELEIVDEIAAPSGPVLVPPVLSPRALAIASDTVLDAELLRSPPLTPGETLLGAPPATRAQPTSRVRRKSTVGPSGGSFD